MSRYIDADDLRHRVIYFADARNLNGNHEQAKAYNHCLIIIDESKTADVVEVVRCKDCANTEKSVKHEGKFWCWVNNEICSADDFCSWGEKRNNEV